ncbi:transposase domain-containing protein [Pseudomonas rustica]|jgi:hypothetical protein|uniref:Transposase domain-containing protein n=1 Tax=Pseudomonas rustica TaxID=2827099 RepID=A0ABS5MVD9_9PSED|nr:transposase domain-containing protein [Pseudomonas rustica]
MTSRPDLDQMPPEQLRTLAGQLMSKVDTHSRKIHRDETIIEQLTHENAIRKRHKFAKRSEQISPAQGSLLDEHDPYAYLKDVLMRLPKQRASEIAQLLPHQWISA